MLMFAFYIRPLQILQRTKQLIEMDTWCLMTGRQLNWKSATKINYWDQQKQMQLCEMIKAKMKMSCSRELYLISIFLTEVFKFYIKSFVSIFKMLIGYDLFYQLCRLLWLPRVVSYQFQLAHPRKIIQIR